MDSITFFEYFTISSSISTYGWLIIGLLFVPLFLTIIGRYRYYRQLAVVAISAIAVGIPFVVWEYLATLQGQWEYNHDHIHQLYFAGVPFERFAYFIVLPFTMLFILHGLRNTIKDARQRYALFFWKVIAFGLLSLAFMSTGNYSQLVFASLSLWLTWQIFFYKSLLISKHYIIYMISGLILFGLFDSIVTWLPIVKYNPDAIIGMKIGTVPVEDLGHFVLLISGYAAVFTFVKNSLIKR